MNKKKTNPSLLKLLWSFFRIGLFTFGGGYAMIPLISKVVVDQEKWLSHEEMLEIMIIAEATPGPISLNIATFVGFKQRNLLGAIFATVGLAIPSLVIITLIAYYIDDFLNNRYISAALSGIKVAVVILVFNALVRLAKLLTKQTKTILIIGLLTVTLFLLDFFNLNISGIFFIIAGGLIGIISYYLTKNKQGSSKK